MYLFIQKYDDETDSEVFLQNLRRPFKPGNAYPNGFYTNPGSTTQGTGVGPFSGCGGGGSKSETSWGDDCKSL